MEGLIHLERYAIMKGNPNDEDYYSFETAKARGTSLGIDSIQKTDRLRKVCVADGDRSFFLVSDKVCLSDPARKDAKLREDNLEIATCDGNTLFLIILL